MSIEYIGNPRPPLSQTSAKEILQRLMEMDRFTTVRRADMEMGFGVTSSENPEEETITVAVNPNEVYVAFHACNRDIREYLTQALSDAIRDAGSVCILEET